MINLRQARKAKARDRHAQQGEVNRVAFGQTKAQRSLERAQQAQHDRHLDGHKLSGGDAHEPD